MSVRLASALALLLMGATPARAATSTVGDTIDLGRGPEGEFCEARRIWNDPATKGVFDRAWDIHCRGWTETVWTGRLYALMPERALRAGTADPAAAHLECSAAGQAQLGARAIVAQRCRDRASGFDAISLGFVRGRARYSAIGLAPFQTNIAVGLQRISGFDAAAGALVLGTLAPAPNRVQTTPSYAVDLGAAGDEVRTYSVRAEHSDAREVANGYLARLAPTATSAERITVLLEAALSESNLAYADAAQELFARADAALAAADAPGGARGDLLRQKLAVYRAIDDVNRRRFEEAIARVDSAFPSNPADRPAGGLTDPAILRALNGSRIERGAQARSECGAGRTVPVRGGGDAVGVRDTGWTASAELRAEALFVRGASLAGLGRRDAADEALTAADSELCGPAWAGLQTARISWLASSIAAERARLAAMRGKADVADRLYTASIDTLDAAGVYRDSPLVAQRRIDRANFRRGRGDAKGAEADFAAALAILEIAGPSGAGATRGLDGYFDLLAREAVADTKDGRHATETFFRAAQFLNPPALTQQIATLKRIYESGSGKGAARARALQDLDRERRALTTRLAGLPDSAAERPSRAQELAATEARITALRTELGGDQQYLSATDSAVDLAAMQATLGPGEGLFKIVWLPRRSYGVFVTRTTARVYPLGLPTGALVTAVATLRRSIEGVETPRGNLLIDFDVATARKLHRALLEPVATEMAGLTLLTVDAAGPFAQLPLGVLVADDASVVAYTASAKANARDYRAVHFLGGSIDLATTVSPRALLVARSQRPSAAPLPYIGFGNPVPPGAAAVASLAGRGAFAGRCPAGSAGPGARIAALRPIPRAELDAGAAALGTGSVIVTGEAFSDAALVAQQDYSQYAVVHFATHGLKEDELGCDSPPGLLTSVAATPSSDGLLSFEEIARLHLDANLVILSACNTAAEVSESRARDLGFRVGQAGQGATLNGLVRAFLVANSRAVLTTHWAIPNKTTTPDGRTLQPSTMLMEALFADARTRSIAGAVRAAQARVRADADLSHPYYWGAFAVVGDGSKTMLSPPPTAIADVRR